MNQAQEQDIRQVITMTTNLQMLNIVQELEKEYGSVKKVPKNHPKLAQLHAIDRQKASEETERANNSIMIKGISARLKRLMPLAEIARQMDMEIEELNHVILKYGLRESYIVLEDTYRHQYINYRNFFNLQKALSDVGYTINQSTINRYLDSSELFENRYKFYSATTD